MFRYLTYLPSRIYPIVSAAICGRLLVSVASGIIFVVIWIGLAIQRVLHWQASPSELHYDLLGLLMFFAVIWAQLVRNEPDAVDFLFVSFAFAAVWDLVQRGWG